MFSVLDFIANWMLFMFNVFLFNCYTTDPWITAAKWYFGTDNVLL